MIILLDGTKNNSIERKTDTNINALTLSLSSNCQVKFYQQGVGENVGAMNGRFWALIGKGVFKAARASWRFISDNYQEGDKIFIFGFSRGAFAARHLAGMIIRYGVRGFNGDIEGGFRNYLKSCQQPCLVVKQEVEFLGLFDCVPANHLYMIRDKNFHLNSSKLEDGILNFRHAVSINERRYSYRPILFERNNQQSFAQHWFPGYHSDVGGHEDNSSGLAAFSLWWMIREAYGLGLNFDNIECPHHRFGHALSVIRAVNPHDKPVNSDYWTTQLGLRWERLKKEKLNLPAETPKFEDLDSCPRCGQPMFDYFQTDIGRQWLIDKGLLNGG